MRCDRLEIISGGRTYDLTDGSSGFVWTKENGFGSTKIKRILESGPFQHGTTNIDFRLQERIVQLEIVAIANDVNKHFTNRDALLTMFNPGNTEFVLRYTYPNGNIRCLDCLLNGGLEFDFDRMKDAKSSKWAVELIAPNPAWYDPSQHIKGFTIATTNQLVFPIVFPIVFGSTGLYLNTIIAYRGNWQEYPSFVLTGPLTSPAFYNLSTNEKIALSYAINNGETVTINLEYGNKTVTNQFGDNIIGTVTDDSDLATFHLAPHPEATNGMNQLLLTATSLLPGTSAVSISYYDRYLGV